MNQSGDCIPFCDEFQCDGDHICPANSSCVELCDGYSCQCDDGFHKETTGYGDSTVCIQDCDENQCNVNPYRLIEFRIFK
jgi:hypothetical protein